MYGNPHGIRRLARDVGDSAEQTRADGTRGGDGHAVQWQSVRAGRYRDQLSDAADAAWAAAAELEELRMALEAHAAAVQQRLEQIAAAERWLRASAASAWDEAQDLAAAAVNGTRKAFDAVVGTVVDTVDTVTDRTDDEARAARQRAESLERELDGLRVGDLRWLGRARDLGWSP